MSYLLPVIEEAHKLGLYVITADYLPDNIAHRYSDEYCNVSIIDQEAVLAEAKKLGVDGVLSHAVDPGVVSAAYVAEKMGLPFQCSYEVACILQDKSRFRAFLSENGFNCPKAKGYNNLQTVLADTEYFSWPVIVKPVDSAGSKGVSRVDSPEQMPAAVDAALSASHSGHFIVEDFLEKDGFSAGSESFVVDGRLLYNGFYDQLFDDESSNPYTPSAECWPSTMAPDRLEEVRQEIQRLVTLLHIKTGIFNIEFRLCKNGKLYLMEVSPRGGGNRLAEMLRYAADVNLIEAEVRKAVGLPVLGMHEPRYKGHFAIQVLHAPRAGVFEGLSIDPSFRRKHIIEEELRISKGQLVPAFTGANAAIGTLLLRFDTRREMEKALKEQNRWMDLSIR